MGRNTLNCMERQSFWAQLQALALKSFILILRSTRALSVAAIAF